MRHCPKVPARVSKIVGSSELDACRCVTGCEYLANLFDCGTRAVHMQMHVDWMSSNCNSNSNCSCICSCDTADVLIIVGFAISCGLWVAVVVVVVIVVVVVVVVGEDVER